MIGIILKYRYAFTLLAVIAALVGLWYHGYDAGVNSVENKLISSTLKSETESRIGANEVRKKEQSFSERQLDISLCSLGIVRGGSGCK